MTTAFFTHPACLEHDYRGKAIRNVRSGWKPCCWRWNEPEFGKLERREAPQAEISHITRVPRQSLCQQPACTRAANAAGWRSTAIR
jgi:hypothetical protein